MDVDIRRTDPNPDGVRGAVGPEWVDTLAGVLAPEPLRELGPKGEFLLNGPVTPKHLRRYGLRFLDVHGDEWLTWFGPVYGNGSELRRLTNASGLWPMDEDPSSVHDRPSP